MIFSGRVSFALTALLSFIAISPAYATGEEGAPSFITEWPLFQRWDAMTGEIPEFDCPGVDDVTLGKWVNSEKKLSWLCYTTKTESQLAPVVSTFVEKATLSYPSEDGEEKTETVVVKRSRSELRPVLYGAKLQSSLDHPNILPILHYVVGESVKNWGVAIMPYVEGGSLESNYAKFSDQGAVNTAFKQMLSAVAAVSAAGIIHRDLKPENFLVDGDNLKLMDFDQARQIETTAQMDVGTSSYQAPEILMGVDYTTKVDTFSLGMSFLVMSVPDLRNSNDRFQLWKDLIEPSGHREPPASEVQSILSGRNYGVFSGNDGLLKVIAKSLCKASERYTPGEFETAFGGAV